MRVEAAGLTSVLVLGEQMGHWCGRFPLQSLTLWDSCPNNRLSSQNHVSHTNTQPPAGWLRVSMANTNTKVVRRKPGACLPPCQRDGFPLLSWFSVISSFAWLLFSRFLDFSVSHGSRQEMAFSTANISSNEATTATNYIQGTTVIHFNDNTA